MNLNEVNNSILGGQFDDDLDAIVNTVRLRKQVLGDATRRSLKSGDTIVFSDVIRPKYLAGLKAEVKKVNSVNVVVRCPNLPDYGRFAGSENVTLPASLIGEVVA